MKEAAKATVGKFAQDEFGPLYNDARRAAAGVDDTLENRVNVDLGLAEKIFGNSESNQYQDRKRYGFQAKMVIRVRWHRELAQGFGAKILASQLRSKNIPMRKKWVIRDRRDVDDVCMGNAREGWIENHLNFRSGHNQPPAHPGCRCKIQVGVRDRNKLRRLIRPVTEPRFVNVNRRARRGVNLNPMRFGVPRVMRQVNIPGAPDIPRVASVADVLRI